MDIGLFLGRYEKYSMYEPEIFEKYAQLLGLNNDHHLAFYGRGAFGGMLFPSRCFMLFKVKILKFVKTFNLCFQEYGHDKLSLVNGGFADWKRQGFEVQSTKGNDYEEVERGNFKAKNDIYTHIISFEEFNKEGGILDDTSLANVFDTRIRPQFEGKQDTGLDPRSKYKNLIPV